MVKNKKVNISLPRQGEDIDTVFPYADLPSIFDSINVLQEEMIKYKGDKPVLVTCPSGFGKTAMIVSKILNNYIKYRNKGEKVLNKKIYNKINHSKSWISVLLSDIFKGKSIKIKIEGERGINAYPRIRNSEINKDEFFEIINYLKKNGFVKTYHRHDNKYMKITTGSPIAFFVCASEGSKKEIKRMFKEYNPKEFPLSVSTNIKNMIKYSIVLLTPSELEKILNKYKNLEKLFSTVKYFVFDDLNKIDNLPLLSYLYNRVDRLLDKRDFSKFNVKKWVLCGDISNWKKFENFFFKGDYKRINGIGKYNKLNISLFDKDNNKERDKKYKNVINELLSKKEQPVLVLGKENKIDKLKKITNSSSFFVEGGDINKGVNIVKKRDKNYLDYDLESLIFYDLSDSFNNVFEIGNKLCSYGKNKMDIKIFGNKNNIKDSYYVEKFDEKMNSKSKRRNYLPFSYGSKKLIKKQLLYSIKNYPMSDSEAINLYPKSLTILTDLQKRGIVNRKYNNWSLTDKGEKYLKKLSMGDKMNIINDNIDDDKISKGECLNMVEDCFTDYLGKKYKVKNIDWDNKNVELKELEEDNLPSFFIPNYNVDIIKDSKVGKARYYDDFKTKCVSLDIKVNNGYIVNNYSYDTKVILNDIKNYDKKEVEERNFKTRGIMIKFKDIYNGEIENLDKEDYDLWDNIKTNKKIHYFSHLMITAMSIFNGVPESLFGEILNDNILILYIKNEKDYGVIENSHRKISKIIKIMKELHKHSEKNIKINECDYGNIKINKEKLLI
ncbi:MAG: hypothetical protein ACOCP8_06335 [archaeon]